MISNSTFPEAPAKAPAKAPVWGALALFLLCGVAFFAGLGGLPLSGPDEPRYAEVGREMFQSGDWITPRLAGYLWFEKPALLYWGQAASYHLFGVNEFAARFPSALAATLMVLFLACALARVGWARWGFWAGATLATSAFWLAMARAATTDMVLASAIGIAVLSGYLAFEARGTARAGWWMLFSCALGAAMLAKGLIALILIFGILGIYCVLIGQKFGTALKNNALLLAIGALAFLLTAGLWYWPVYRINGMVFINEFFVNHHFKRFLTDKYHHPEPAYFYVFMAFVGVLPWSFFLPGGLARLRSLRARDDARGALLLLAWIWALLPIAFFSISKSKLPAYVLPSFPALAIILGAELERVWDGEVDIWSKIGVALTAIVALGVGIGFPLYLWHEGVRLGDWGALGLLVPPLVGLIVVAAWLLKMRRLALGTTLALMMVIVAGAVGLLFAHLGPQIAKREVALAAAADLKAGENIVFYRKQKEYAPVFYAQGRTLFYHPKLDAAGNPIPGQSTLLPRGTLSTGDEIDAETLGELRLAINQSPTRSLVVITEMPGATELASTPGLFTRFIAQQGEIMALRVSKQSAK